jgi:hypothetical protein
MRGQQDALARREILSVLNIALSQAAIVDKSVSVSYIACRQTCLHAS